MGKKNSKKIQQQLEKKKKKELKKSKIDKLNYAIIIFIMIILPLWQIVRIQFISLNRTDLYNDLHAGYFLWIAGAGLLITYIINLIKKRIKIDKVDLTIYFFIISVIISTILAEDKNLAIFGINDRYEGILTLISYALIILTVKSLPFKRRYLTFINILMILGVVQSFTAIIQCFVRSNYILKFSFSFMANALCGNPNYLGSYMMIESLLAIGMYLFSEKYNKMYFGLALLFVFSLILAQSSSPLLGLAIGLLFLLIYVFIHYRDKFTKALLISFASAIVAIISIYGTIYIYTDVFKMPVYKNYTIKSDITQLFSKMIGKDEGNEEYYKNIDFGVPDELRDELITDQSFYSSRLYIWNVSSQIIKEHFFFGCGPDNFALNFQKHEPMYIDRAHNVYIHIFATLGLFGFVSYMLLIVFTLVKGIFSKNKITIVCFTAFLAYIVHAFFTVNVIEVVPYFYIILGIILASYDKDEKIYD